MSWLFWALSQTKMTDFPTLLNTSTSEIHTLSYTWSLEKWSLSGGAFPYRPLQEVPPGAPRHSENKKETEDGADR